jgi:hypothetical protein
VEGISTRTGEGSTQKIEYLEEGKKQKKKEIDQTNEGIKGQLSTQSGGAQQSD